MSDARAATDAGLRGVEPADEHEIADALQATAGLHAACITRVCAGGIRALVARIRELEAERDHWKATFHALYVKDVSFHAAITKAALLAWPHAEDVGSDAPHIIAELAEERDAALKQAPPGWQVVPKEPTVAMERSAAGRDTRDEGIASMYSGIYRAMLAAAPRP